MKTNEQRIKLDTQQAKDAIELHLRREVERIADEQKMYIVYRGGRYTTYCDEYETREAIYRHITLPELHDKLKELEKGD